MRTIGRLWMGVTLDDQQIAAIGTRAAGGRALSEVSEIVGMELPELLLSIARLLRGILGIGLVGAVVAGAVALGKRDATSSGALAEVSLYLLGGCAALLFIGFVIFVLGFPLWFSVVVLGDSRSDNPHNRRYVARSRADLVRVRDEIRSARLSPFAHKLAVVSVASSIWQEAVGGFAVLARIPLVDISYPTEPLAWEVREMLGRFGARCVFVGADQRLAAIMTSADPYAIEVRTLLAGHPVLSYQPGQTGRRRFTRALRATFEARARLPLPTKQPDPLVEPAG